MARPADPNARSALVAAARSAFERHGIQKTRIEDITSACGVSKGAFYLHFESKEALFGELVTALISQMDSMLEARFAEQAALVGNKPSRRALAPSQLAVMEQVDARHDLKVLELMWEMRDVVHVLLSGAKGTEFEGVFWHVVDREVSRVAAVSDQLKAFGMCRREIPSELIGSMVVGTWLLLVRQMVGQRERPDFEAWVQGLMRLISDGMAPRPPVRVRAARRSPPRPHRERRA